jgi:hypothetical protein
MYTVFKDLIEQYPTWEQLERYLESEEGGIFRVVDRSMPCLQQDHALSSSERGSEDGLCLIRYEKGVSNMSLPHSKWFRSVVWDTKTNRPVSVAPPKAAAETCPFFKEEDRENAGIVCQELLDGVMITIFKRARDQTLHITSRSKLDAAGRFYSSKSFRHLFIEAYTGWIVKPEESLEWLIQQEAQNRAPPDESKGEKAICYSFLVQHTEHRIVKEITRNVAFLIHKGIFYEDGTMQINDQMTEVDIPHHIVSLPPTLVVHGDLNAWLELEMRERSWDFQGIVLKDHEGNRWRWRSEKYKVVKSLRGNSPELMDRFVQLYLQNVTPMYLDYYPEDAISFSFYTEFMHQVVKIMYESYMKLRVHHSCTIDQIDKMYHPHLYALHGIYLAHFQPIHKKMTANDVYTYIRSQPWQRVAFLLRKYIDGFFSAIQQTVEEL